MSDRIKLYIVSILGIAVEDDPSDSDKPQGRYIHVPLLLEGKSIEDVEEDACIQANRLFSEAHGYKTRHIMVKQRPPEGYLRLLQLSHLGLRAASDEPVEQVVEFMCSLDTLDPDDNVVFEFGKLAS
jgi:hypothetical protein